MKIFVQKTKIGSMVPCYEGDREALKKIKAGSIVMVTISRPRNVAFHRKFFGLLEVVFENLDEDAEWKVGENVIKVRSVEDLLWHVKMQMGHYKQRITIGGKITYEAQSISFGAMSEDEFSSFYSKALNVLLKYFLPLDGEQRRELEERIVLDFA